VFRGQTSAPPSRRHLAHWEVVSEMLGHASVAITLDIYVHMLPDMQQDAASAMTRLLTPPESEELSRGEHL